MSESPELAHANGWAGYENLQQFMEMDEWNPQAVDGSSAFVCGFRGANGDQRVLAQVNVEREVLLVYAYAMVNVPEHRRSAMAEFVTRANYGMLLGNFELDLRDGEIRYKCSLGFRDVPLTHPMIAQCLYPAVQVMDQYLPGVLGVGFGDKDPDQVVTEIENAQPPTQGPPQGGAS
jgi:hypothetical protein